MQQPTKLMFFAAAALALGSPAAASAQSSPAPAISPMPSATSSGTTGTPVTPAPEPSSGSTRSSLPGKRTTAIPGDVPAGAQIKPLKTASLTRSQVIYGLTHQAQEAQQIAKLKTVDFNNLRVYRLPLSLKTMFHVSDAESQALVVAMLGEGVRVAQTTPALPGSNGNNSPIQYLRQVLANINVSNALNNLNVLNNSNVNVNVALQNVLNNNKISIGQVVGLYIGGGGIITTITK
jgi:hypothetical protein